MRSLFFAKALLAGTALCCLSFPAHALSLEDFGSPQAFTEKNRSEFTFGLLEVRHRFIAVFGGKCDGPPLDDEDKDKDKDKGPKPPPGPEPKPGPGPKPGPRADGVITVIPGGGKALLELLSAAAERNVSVAGFDPLSEQQIVTEFGGDNNVDVENNDVVDIANNNNNAGAGAGGGGFAPQNASDTLGAPPDAAYFQIAANGDITVLPAIGGESIQLGTDNATDAFIFPNNGFVFEDPVVAPGFSLTIPVGASRTVIIRGPGGERFRVSVLILIGQATITVQRI